MRPNDSYEKSSYYRQQNQPTATKSQSRRINQTQAYTPTRFSRNPNQRLSHLRNNINECIEQIQNKKQTNNEAIQEVKHVNKQVLQTLSTQASEKNYKSSRQAYEDNRIPQFNTENAQRLDPRQQKQREHVTLSSFHLAPAQNAYRQSNFHVSEIYRPESVISNHTEMDDMRQRIRSQRNQNDQLQRQIQILRRQQQQLSFVGSNYGSGQNSYLMTENARLRQQLSRMESQNNMSDIYEQFKRLKEDNERLRRETITMLKNVRY